MYFGLFFFSLLCIVIAIGVGVSTSDIDDMSKIDEYYRDFIKHEIIAIILSICAIALSVVPIVDSKTFHDIQVKDTSYHYIEATKTVRESNILKVRTDSSYSWDEPSTWYIWLTLLGGSVALLAFIGKCFTGKNDQIQRIKQKEWAEAERLDKIRREKEAETQAIQYITDNFGKPDKIIHTTSAIPPDWSKTVFFVFDKELMYYNDRVVRFNEIIACECVDNSSVETKQTGTATTEMSTNTGSMVGRALVGGVLAGGAGAIIGGATAKQTGETIIESNSISVTNHDYTILINTKNVRNPLLKIPCGRREKEVHEIMATLNAAIASIK